MIILINASDIKAGGGIQVADSVCCELNKYPQHRFIAVLSSYMKKTAERTACYANVEVIKYDCPKYNVRLLLTGRDAFMDRLVKDKRVDTVISIFGPNLWVPRCPHISGFARPHLVIPESPYFTRMDKKERLKEDFSNAVLKYFFRRSSDFFYTENPYISERLKKMLPGSTVYTITNNYNQIFEQPEKWVEKKLPAFDGASFLCVTAPYPHKNLQIAIDVAKYLKQTKPGFKFRFVYTINKTDFVGIPEYLINCFLMIGKVDITECPSLYEQCTIAFQPSLLECFTATYPEAMIMRKPIVTTNLEFAQGLCGEAACYYEAINPVSAAESLYKVATDREYAETLVDAGQEMLKTYDTYSDRARKIIDIAEQISLMGGAICELIANGEEQIISTTCCRTLAFEGRRMAA